jgi:2'-5' RNA ligase
MRTRLHRLYRGRLAQTYQDLPEEMQVVQDQMEEAGGEPVKIQYEEDEAPKLKYSPSVVSYAIDNISDWRVALVEMSSGMISIYISTGSDTSDIYVVRDDEFSLNGVSQGTPDEIIGRILQMWIQSDGLNLKQNAIRRDFTGEEIELIKNIIAGHDTEDIIPPFFKRMDVNIVDELDGLEDCHQLSLPEEFPAGEGDDSQHTRPGLDGPGHNLPRIEGAVFNRMGSLIIEAAVGNIVRLIGFPEPVAQEINRLYPYNDVPAARVIKLLNNGSTDIQPEQVSGFTSPILGELQKPNISSKKVKFINTFSGQDYAEFEQVYATQFQEKAKGEKITESGGFSWVIIPPEQYVEYAKLMQHCSSFEGVIYSLQDAAGNPHVTADVAEGMLIQLQGKQNSEPAPKYLPYVKQLITSQNIWIGPDIYESIQALLPNNTVDSVIDQVRSGLIDVSTLSGILRIQISGDPSTPAEVLLQLSIDKEWHVRIETARNPNTPAAALIRLAEDVDADVRDNVVYHPNTPVEVIAKLAMDASTNVRREVARSLRVPVEILIQLSRDEDAMVRVWIADNHNTPAETLTRLAGDENKDVRDIATKSLKNRGEVLAEPKISAFNRSAAKGNGVIFAVLPTKEATEEIASELGDQLLEYPEDLHITLLFLEDPSPDDIDRASAIADAVCGEFQQLHCKMQGLGLFDHEDEHGKRAFYSSVDAVGMAELRTSLMNALRDEGIKVSNKYDFTPHMTLGYVDPRENIDFNTGSPGVEWVSSTIVLINKGEVSHFDLGGVKKEAGGFGLSLHDITSPGEGQGGTDNWSDNHETENIEEDVDLKMGDVEEPYSQDQGPLNFRFDDDKKYDIVKGAEPDEKEAVGIPDEGMNENGYGSDYTRTDQAIPRPHSKEDLVYGK